MKQPCEGIQAKVFAAKCPTNNDMNMFGDYSHVVIVCVRDADVMETRVTPRITALFSSKANTLKVLTPEEYAQLADRALMDSAKEVAS